MLQELEQQTNLTKNQWLIASAATIGNMLDFFRLWTDRFCPGVHRQRLAPDFRGLRASALGCLRLRGRSASASAGDGIGRRSNAFEPRMRAPDWPGGHVDRDAAPADHCQDR
jgi:hypothetical protein